MNTRNLLSKGTLKLLFALTCMSVFLHSPAVHAQGTAVTKLNFKKDKYNRIFIPAKIDRDSVSLLFGTYSKTLRLTPYFLESRQLYPSWDVLTVTDKRGRQRDRMLFYLPKVEVGNIKFRNEETAINGAFPDSIATGSTGTLMVYQYNWKIDNDRNMISISKAPFAPSQVYTTINYKNTSFPTAVVHIGNVNSEFILDLGSGAGFQISTNTALGQQILDDYRLRPSRTVVSNIHARRMVDTLYEVVIPSMTFNGIRLKNQKVTLSSASPHNIIGTGFLGNYNVILNNSKKRKIDSSFILDKRLVD